MTQPSPEHALDALLEDNQQSLLETVGQALDTSAGLEAIRDSGLGLPASEG
ncbi:hypothetical protein ACWGQT_00090 [Streptomyces yangpuensis]